jgi:hypothetical protein
LIAKEPIRIGCVAISQGALFDGIEWFKDGKPLSTEKDPRINITNVPVDKTYTNVILTIVNTTSNDSGLYTCDANFLRHLKVHNDTIAVVVTGKKQSL